jgi:hypothetical protein
MVTGIYPLSFKMPVSERLSDFNSRRRFAIRVFPYKNGNDEVILLKGFFDGVKKGYLSTDKLNKYN